MNSTHVTVGSVIGGVGAYFLAKYGVNVSAQDAAFAGAALAGIGSGLAKVVATQGLWPAVRRIFVGPPKTPPVV